MYRKGGPALGATLLLFKEKCTKLYMQIGHLFQRQSIGSALLLHQYLLLSWQQKQKKKECCRGNCAGRDRRCGVHNKNCLTGTLRFGIPIFGRKLQALLFTSDLSVARIKSDFWEYGHLSSVTHSTGGSSD